MNPLFQKPKGVRYVDMAIWIDNNFYKEDCDEDKAFTYMYLLAYMLASKAKYFQNIDDYDGYATHLAYATYKRMKDPNKVKLKSVLNYMKSVMYFRKMSYQNEAFAEIIDPIYNVTWNGDLYKEKSINSIEASMNDSLHASIEDIIASIPTIVKNNIPKIYKTDKVVYHNLYISLLLSLLSRSILPKKYEDYMKRKLANSVSFDEIGYYRKHLDTESIILWKIPESMVPAINLILKKVKIELVDEIKDVANDFKVTEDVFRYMSNDMIFGDATDDDKY